MALFSKTLTMFAVGVGMYGVGKCFFFVVWGAEEERRDSVYVVLLTTPPPPRLMSSFRRKFGDPDDFIL